MTFTNTPLQTTTVNHPLEPLTPQEIEDAVAIVRNEKKLGELVRFVSVTHHEPDPEVALAFQPGQPFTREAFVVLLDKGQDPAVVYEAVITLTTRTVTRYERIPNVQSSIIFDEFMECEEIVKADPRFVAALEKRGITDLSLVRVDPWSAGNYGDAKENQHRILRSTVHLLLPGEDQEANSYAHPVEGLHAIINTVTREVLRIDDFGVVLT
jgi:primary-amine oxidase